MNHRVGQIWQAYFDVVKRQKHVVYVVVNTRPPNSHAEARVAQSYHTIAVLDCFDPALEHTIVEEPEIHSWEGSLQHERIL